MTRCRCVVVVNGQEFPCDNEAAPALAFCDTCRDQHGDADLIKYGPWTTRVDTRPDHERL